MREAMKTISDIKAAFSVPQLVVEADPPTIAAQTGGKVSFLEALKQAIQSFLEDGRNYDSPVGSILADPGAFDLPDVPDNINTSDLIRDWMHDSKADLEYDAKIAPAATEMVRSWMNDPSSKIMALRYLVCYLAVKKSPKPLLCNAFGDLKLTLNVMHSSLMSESLAQ